jgi:thiosulfate dehydrogenase
MSRKISVLGGILMLASLGGAAAPPALAQDASDETELGPVFLLALGGKLYDDLWTILDELPPEERNPAISGALSVSRRDSWRCVTCHGWDYSGATVEGKEFPGLTGLVDADPEIVRGRLRDPAHPFPADRLSDTAMDILALFVTQGQYARNDYIRESGVAVGNPEFGRDIFEGACISCHQLDGRRYLKGETGDRSSLGWVSRNRPEQAIHKILNGVPAAEMLSLRFLSDIQVADLLAYLQALDPNEK